jgi:hypothetical protein
MHRHIKASFDQVVKGLSYAQSLNVHKPVIGAAKSAYKAATHPITKKVAKTSVHIGVKAVKIGHKLVTHPTTAKSTHKVWLHGSKAAKHTGKFMVKVALTGFKLRRQKR